MVGYSGTPLPRKLGIKTGHRVVWLGAPDDFGKTLGPLPDAVEVEPTLSSARSFDVIVLFVKSSAMLRRRFPAAVKRLEQDGGLWVAWPKKASKVPTDMTEDVVRDVALPAGLVDNKVCAVDETWSALRCVIRRENRVRAR